MPNGFGGRGFGRGGWGFGFRGSSPPWPFVGIGRGGLPRCGYFLSGAAGMPISPGYPSYSPSAMPYYGGYAPPPEMMPGAPAPEAYGSPGAMPYYGGSTPPPGMMPGAPAPGAYGSPGAMPYYGGTTGYPYAPQMTREQELDFLRSQAQAIKGQLEQIDARIKELETE